MTYIQVAKYFIIVDTIKSQSYFIERLHAPWDQDLIPLLILEWKEPVASKSSVTVGYNVMG
jgi:hypothetical protein